MIILKLLILGFAFVGLVASGNWVFKSKWSVIAKTLAGVVLIGLGTEMLKTHAPLIGLFNPIAAFLATGGIVIIASWIVRHKKFKTDWRPKVVAVISALALMAFIWTPVFMNPTGSLPSIPNINNGVPGSSRPIKNSYRSNDKTPCDQLPYDLRQSLESCKSKISQ